MNVASTTKCHKHDQRKHGLPSKVDSPAFSLSHTPPFLIQCPRLPHSQQQQPLPSPPPHQPLQCAGPWSQDARQLPRRRRWRRCPASPSRAYAPACSRPRSQHGARRRSRTPWMDHRGHGHQHARLQPQPRRQLRRVGSSAQSYANPPASPTFAPTSSSLAARCATPFGCARETSTSKTRKPSASPGA